MAHQEKVQLVFAGVRPNMAEHLVSDNELVSATNIDFGLERGAASVRRGSFRTLVAGEAAPVYRLNRAYQQSLANSLFFARVGTTVYSGSTSLSLLISSLSGSDINDSDMGFTTYREDAFLGYTPGSSAAAVDTAGTARDWVLTAPSTACTAVSSTLTPLAMTSSTWSVTEGTSSGVSGGTTTGIADGATGRLTFVASPGSPNMDLNGTNTLGDYSTAYISIWVDEPSDVDKLSLDFSILNSTFDTSYYHTEMDVVLGETTLVDPVKLVDALINAENDGKHGGGAESHTISGEERENMIADMREGLRVPVTHIAASKESWTVWSIPRPNFNFIGNAVGTSTVGVGWDSIGAVRLTVEARSGVEVRLKDHFFKGAESYPLNDPAVGYSYWVTHARQDSDGLTLQESAPSPASTRLKCIGAQNVITDPNSLATWATHRIFYTQGGYLRQPYAFATATGTANVGTHSQSDVKLIGKNLVMETDVRPTIPNNIKTCSEPFHDRIFVGYGNKIAWTKPGQPGTFPWSSQSRVSHEGDQVQSLLAWSPGLVIINRDSIYEMNGTIFEGSNSDWVLQRTGSRHGSKAVNVPIKTPYGIPIIDYDGFYLYQPGQGVDSPIAWAQEVISDAFKGSDSSDPVAIKGSRIPAINLSYIFNASAAYADDRIYLAVPTGSDQYASTVFVFDFRQQQVWWYEYPFNIYSMFWDAQNNRLLAGSSSGAIIEIEENYQDQNVGGTNTAITYSLKTKRWSTPTEAVLENLQIEYEGGPAVVKALLDGTATVTLGTVTNTVHDWEPLTFNGTVANSIQFLIDGTRESSADKTVLYGMAFDALYEPARVKYFKTDYFDNQYGGEKYWDVDISSIEIPGSDTVTKVSFIDGTAVMTNTCVGPTSGQEWFHHSYPAETYGDIAYTTYTSTGEFKLWQNKWAARNEPPPVNTWKSDVESLEEFIIDAIDVDINPNGTASSIVYVDNTAVSTATFTGTKRQSYTHAIPDETYGRTIYAQHNGNSIKVYNTWFHKRPQPDRWTNFVTDKIPLPADSQPRTLLATLDCLGNNVQAVVVADGTAIETATFSGAANHPETFRHELDMNSSHVIRKANNLYVMYDGLSGGKFKHFQTKFEVEDMPFGKKEWTMTFKKLGGATEFDMARFWSLDVEGEGTATLTSMWDYDFGTTNTQTHTVTGREYLDRMSFPPGIRSRLWQVRIWSSQNFQVYKSNLDIIREGKTGVTVVTRPGVPTEDQKIV